MMDLHLTRRALKASWVLGILGASSGALAAGATAPAATGPKVEMLWRFGITNNDDGFNKETEAVETTSIATKKANLVISGDATDKVAYKFRYDLFGNAVEYAYADVRLISQLNLLLGRAKVRNYGFDKRDGSPLSVYGSVGEDSDPFKSQADLVSFVYRFKGTFTLQLIDDKGYHYNKTVGADDALPADKEVVDKNPAYAFEYLGQFGAIQPLLQVMTYDLGHSNMVTVGAKFQTKRILVAADYTMNNEAFKGSVDAAGKTKELTNKHTRLSLAAEFDAGLVTPWVQYSNYNKEDGVESGAKEAVVNSAYGVLDDNAANWSIGAWYNRFGEAFRPYLGVEQVSGKFNDKDGKEKELAEMHLTLGAFGSF